MLRHVNLSRRATHQGSDRKRSCRTAESPGENPRQNQCKNAKERRDLSEGCERIRSKAQMPNIDGKKVKEADWWQDCLVHLALDFNVFLNHLRICPQAVVDNSVKITAIQTFIEPNPIHLWLGMEKFERMNRIVTSNKDGVR